MKQFSISTCANSLLEDNQGVFANPLSDTAFKKIFGSEEYKEVTIGLINSFIPERKIASLEFVNVEMQGQTEKERRSAVDVICTDENGAKFVVEMQKAKQENFRERMIYYASRIISGKLGIKGKKWDYKIDQVYVFAFTNFSFTDVIHDVAFDGQFVLNYETLEKTTKTKMPSSPVYFFFDLIRFNKKVEEIVHSPEKWLFLVKNSAKLSAMPKEFSGDSAVESYFSASRLAKFSPEENDQYNSDMRNEWDIANEKAFIKKEGHAEGVAKRNIEIARAMLSKGIDIPIISECTGLSQQEIKAL